MQRSAINLSRSEFEFFTFGTKYGLSETAIDKILEIVSNVSAAWVCNILFFWQAGFDPNDIQYTSMKGLSKAAQCAMLPDSPIHCVDLTVGMVSPTFRFYCTVSNIGELV